MKTPDFLNRDKEFKLFENHIYKKAASTTGRAILLYSNPGIGKARFVQEYVAKHYPNLLYLDVKIASSSSMIASPYQFVNALYLKVEEIMSNKVQFNIISSIEFTWKILSLSLSFEKIGRASCRERV